MTDLKHVCPVCGFEFIHITGISISLDNSCPNEKTYHIHFCCESGHTWQLSLEEHEGNIFSNLKTNYQKSDQEVFVWDCPFFGED